jgi:hypothetical protein
MVDRCTELGLLVQEVRAAWLRMDAGDDVAEPELRRRWLAAVGQLGRAEAALERDTCRCGRCSAAREDLTAARRWFAAQAGSTGLPLPIEGQEMRLPVHVAALESRAERLLRERAITPLGGSKYLVHTPGGQHLVQAGRAEYWETDWSCSCAWSQPYAPDLRPGRGCTHVRAVRLYRTGTAGSEPSDRLEPLPEVLRRPLAGRLAK